MKKIFCEHKIYALIVCCLLEIIAIFQHRSVMMYTKDYSMWGGTWEIVQAIQPMVLLGIWIVMGKIIAEYTCYEVYKCIAVCMVLYGLLDLRFLREEIYYFSSSVVELWPLLPLLIAIYLLLKKTYSEKKNEQVFISILILISAVSREFMALFVVAFIFLYAALEVITKKKVEKSHLVFGGVAVMGAAISFVCHTTFMVEGYYVPIDTANLWNDLAECYMGTDNLWLMVFVALVVGCAACIAFQKNIILEIAALFVAFLIAENSYEIEPEVSTPVKLWIGTCCVVLLLFYLHKKKRNLLLAAVVAVCLVQLAMLVCFRAVPLSRMIMTIVMHLVGGACIIDIWLHIKGKYAKDVVIASSCIGALAVILSVVTLVGNYLGYQENSEVYKINYARLKQLQTDAEEAAKTRQLILYKVPNETYAADLLYNSDKKANEEMLKSYYNIPSNVRVCWTNQGEELSYYVVDGTWYDDGWLGDRATVSFTSEIDQTIILQFYHATGESDMKITCKFLGEEKVYELSEVQAYRFEVEIPKGTNEMEIIASKTHYPTNGDPRELSVVFGVINE